MKITLIHNPGAGDGQDVKALVRLISDAGHDLRYRSSKKGWERLLDERSDLVVAAGGDGTVGKVAVAAADRGLPFAAVAIGTANNIAKTIGVLGDAAELIETWSTSPRSEQPFDLGEVVAPWGSMRFVEGVGGGLIADLIAREAEVAADATLLGRETDRALHVLAELVRASPVRLWQVHADGKDLSGSYFSLEVLNIKFVGPNLPLAPDAFPGDGLLDVVMIGESDRESLLAYLEDRQRLASAQMPKLRVARARHIEVVTPVGVHWHVDDGNWPGAEPLAHPVTLTVRCLPGAVTFVATLNSSPHRPG